MTGLSKAIFLKINAITSSNVSKQANVVLQNYLTPSYKGTGMDVCRIGHFYSSIGIFTGLEVLYYNVKARAPISAR